MLSALWWSKWEGTRDQIANIRGSLKKQESSRKTSMSAKAFDCVDHHKLGNSERHGNTRPPDLLLRNLYAGQ